jgi:hypothetical protein
MPASIRRMCISEKYGFYCKCHACENNLYINTLDSLPAYDRVFDDFDVDFLKDFEELVNAFKERSVYMKKHFKNFPSLELAVAQMQMISIMDQTRDIIHWPF